jgi:hypothetical protein
MPINRTIRRASLTAVLCAALSAPALAQHGPPSGAPGGPPGDRRMGMGPGHGMGPGQWRFGGMGAIGALMGARPMALGSKIEHVEGRIAFVKAELAITAQQERAWDAFAAALRENAKQINEAYSSVTPEAAQAWTPLQRLAWQERALVARVEAFKRARASFEPLYAALGEEQKKKLDEMLAGAARLRGPMRRGSQP